MSEKCIISYGLRKVMRLNRTNTVSLPKAWCVRVGIEKGEDVEVFLTDSNNLLIKPTEVRKDEGKACAAMG